MNPEEAQKLTTRLLQKTKEGALDWKVSHGQEGEEFRVNFPRSSIELFRAREKAGLFIYNSQGAIIDVVRSDSDDMSLKLEALYNAVKNAAYQIDETMQDIFSNLK